MRKKKILFTILLLLIVAIPFIASIAKNIDFSSINLNRYSLDAAVTVTPGYSYGQKLINADDLYSSSKRGVNKQMPKYCVSSSSCHEEQNNWFFHEARKDGKYYFGYCLHIGKTAHETYEDGGTRTPKLTAYIYDDNFDPNVIKDRNGNPIDANRLKLLQALLASGYQYSTDGTKTINNMSNTDALYMLTKQILVWEIVEGGRTSFNNEAPEWNGSNSAYELVITKGTAHGGTSLRTYYNYHITEARKYLSESAGEPSPIFGKTYTMRWDSSSKKFTTGTITGLGGYSSCVSSNADVSVSVDVNNKSVVVTSSKSNQNATITCTKVTGNGQNKWIYYGFKKQDGSTELTGWQDIINGSAGTTTRKTFDVKSESSTIKITKVAKKDSSSAVKLSGSKFTLTKKDNTNIKYNLDGNGNAVTLSQSGIYILRETTVPHGYSGIPDTELSIDLSNRSITCPNSRPGKDSNNNVTCQGGLITIKFENNTFELIIGNVEKEFAIQKVNKDKGPINGATFKMYTGSNFGTEVKFNKTDISVGNVFTYDANGMFNQLTNVESSVYYIKLLPKGIYKIVETAVPAPYVLIPSEADRTIYIKVEDNYAIYLCNDSTCNQKSLVPGSTVPTITVTNYTTTVSIKKIGNGGNKLANVKFVLFKEDKTTYVRSTLSNGKYNYSGTTTNIADATVYITGTNGIFTVDNLPAGTYYFKEIETVPPYVLPEGDDAYTKVVITMTKNGPKVNGTDSSLIEISNATKVFNFYKIDEQGNYLAGGKYKLQKYNNDKGKYEDIKVKSVTNDGSYPAESDIFKEDENGKVQFTLSHGIATFIEMAPSSTYRVVELEAPKGYDITNVENSAVIKIDANGYAKGSATIINQKRVLEGSTAQAELIIEIQTGNTIIRYGAIITGTLLIIAGLMGTLIYVSKKRK